MQGEMTVMTSNFRWVLLAIVLQGCADRGDWSAGTSELNKRNCDTLQIFGTPAHTGSKCAPPSALNVMAQIVTDPDAEAETFDLSFRAAHVAAPLTRGPWVITETRAGFSDIGNKDTITHGVTAHRWIGPELKEQWHFNSRWKPVESENPFASPENIFESLFQPVLTEDAVFVPYEAGQLAKLNLATGAVQEIINPFAGTPFSNNLDLVVNNALAINDGNIWYTAVAWPASHSREENPLGSWLVRVNATTNVSTIVPWSQIASAAVGVKQPQDLCTFGFELATPRPALPWPGPNPDSVGPQLECTVQRPTVNAAIAFTAEGLAIVTSTARRNIQYGYLIAVNTTTLQPVWAGDFRDKFRDGCGFLIPYESMDPDAFFACRDGAPPRIDPRTGELPAGQVSGVMASAPVVLPDGTVVSSSFTDYNNNEGHLLRFEPTTPIATKRQVIPYGWEHTPSVDVLPNGEFDLVMPFNEFSTETGDGQGIDGTYIAARFESPAFIAFQMFVTVPKSPESVAYDWVDAQPLLDTDGNSYSINADGHLYKISRAGIVTAQVDLGISMETMGELATWGVDGTGNPVIYVAHAGSVFAIGGGPAMPHPIQMSPRGHRTHLAGQSRKSHE